MRIIVCGGRDYDDRDKVRAVLHRFPRDAIVVTGGAPGADRLANELAQDILLDVDPHPAKWQLYGKAAGAIRNREMLRAGADYVVAFPGGNGTADMITIAMHAGVPVLSCDAVLAEWKSLITSHRRSE